MGDNYKQYKPLGSAAQLDTKAVVKVGPAKLIVSGNENSIPIPKPRPTEGQRLKALALGYKLNVPDDVDFDQNLARSRKIDLIPLDFYHQVKTGGPWDYKQRPDQDFENLGNYHFGVMARAAGFKRDTVLRMSGWAHQRDNDNVPDSWTDWGSAFLPILGVGGQSPFGDAPRDQDWITKGMDDYDKVHGTGKYAEIPLYLRKPDF